MKLWDKGKGINKFIEDFTVGDDYILDEKLVYYDCVGSIAHVKTLERAGILSSLELEKVVEAIEEIQKYGLTIKKEDEDVHTAIENYLSLKLGDIGKKIHTGRSRNDQIMVDLQLWIRDELLKLHSSGIKLCESINNFSRENSCLMAGYTHMQKAMPSSIQLLMGSYIESVMDDLTLLETVYTINNVNPLGSAAGYGSSLNLDRDYTAQLLGFDRSRNCIYVQNRPKLMSTVMFPLLSLMKSLDKISSDFMLFTMSEFNFFSLPDEFCTGSSIMPQKKNYDLFELLRAKASVLQSLIYSVDMVGSKLISGYNRDYQITKKPLMESFDITHKSVELMIFIFENLKVNKKIVEDNLTPEIFATDYAYELVKDGKPFRDAYVTVAKNLEDLKVPEDIFDRRDFLKFRDYGAEITEKKQWEKNKNIWLK